MGQVARDAMLSLRPTLRLWISWINPDPLLPALLAACFFRPYRNATDHLQACEGTLMDSIS